MNIVCWQTILMKYHTLFVIFKKKAAKFEIVVCCKLWINSTNAFQYFDKNKIYLFVLVKVTVAAVMLNSFLREKMSQVHAILKVIIILSLF